MGYHDYFISILAIRTMQERYKGLRLTAYGLRLTAYGFAIV